MKKMGKMLPEAKKSPQLKNKGGGMGPAYRVPLVEQIQWGERPPLIPPPL
jgi:hypothetical protein